MKTTIKSTLALILALLISLCLFSCKKDETENPQTPSGAENEPGGTIAPEGLWKDAIYLSDAEFGEGAKTVTVKVIAEDKSVTFTVKTDAKTLGEALLEHELVAGEQGDFGLYIKYVNGIRADYDLDGAYWGFNKGGEYMMTGVDGTTIADGEKYELVWTKG